MVERTGLSSLLQERQLITATRKELDGDNAKPLPPLHFAGLLIEGGIIAFDANTVTGGLGANFLGIGGDTQYQQDTVTVGMRVTSVQSGEVLTSVTTTKTVYSIAVDVNEYKYVAVNRLLQIEAGLPGTSRRSSPFARRSISRFTQRSSKAHGRNCGVSPTRRNKKFSSINICATTSTNRQHKNLQGCITGGATAAATSVGCDPHGQRQLVITRLPPPAPGPRREVLAVPLLGASLMLNAASGPACARARKTARRRPASQANSACWRSAGRRSPTISWPGRGSAETFGWR